MAEKSRTNSRSSLFLMKSNVLKGNKRQKLPSNILSVKDNPSRPAVATDHTTVHKKSDN